MQPCVFEGVAGYELYADLLCRLPHQVENAAQILGRQTFVPDNTAAMYCGRPPLIAKSFTVP